MKLYLSGLISGGGTLDDDQIRANHARFACAAAALRAQGHDVVNPVDVNGYDRLGHVRRSWREYTAAALHAMLDCDGIVLLDGWQNSPGARLEQYVADALGMDVRHWDEAPA